MLQFKLVAVLMLASVAYCQTTDRPPLHKGCVNTNDCAATECCVLDGFPDSTASCQALREDGERCRPYNKPTNTDLTYPNGDRVTLTNVYFATCNCAEGLTCNKGTCEKNVAEEVPEQ